MTASPWQHKATSYPPLFELWLNLYIRGALSNYTKLVFGQGKLEKGAHVWGCLLSAWGGVWWRTLCLVLICICGVSGSDTYVLLSRWLMSVWFRHVLGEFCDSLPPRMDLPEGKESHLSFRLALLLKEPAVNLLLFDMNHLAELPLRRDPFLTSTCTPFYLIEVSNGTCFM